MFHHEKVKDFFNKSTEQTFNSTQDTLNLYNNSENSQQNSIVSNKGNKSKIKFNYSSNNEQSNSKVKKVHLFQKNNLHTVYEEPPPLKFTFDHRPLSSISVPTTTKHECRHEMSKSPISISNYSSSNPKYLRKED